MAGVESVEIEKEVCYDRIIGPEGNELQDIVLRVEVEYVTLWSYANSGALLLGSIMRKETGNVDAIEGKGLTASFPVDAKEFTQDVPAPDCGAVLTICVTMTIVGRHLDRMYAELNYSLAFERCPPYLES